ncbi:MAG: C10 family peptidase [Paludibacter sp.]|nr:C10 family peptidase [Paludibacter sp.]
MKKINLNNISSHSWLLLFVLFSITFFPLNAETPNVEGAKQFAEKFFKGNSPQFAPGKAAPTIILERRYQSQVNKKTSVFAFQQSESGFALVAQNNGKFAIVGYAPEGKFDIETIPPALSALIKLYEDSLEIIGEPIQKSINSKVVVEPLLNTKGIALNQYAHEYAGGCPTGCVATAFAQIMSYYKYPEKGIGSHCYTHPKYGEICADFENTTYNWNNPTNEDYKKLSSHVGIAMDMNYCGSNYGSIPATGDYKYALQKYFGYHVYSTGSTIKNELANSRPVYVELLGEPVGHAFVVDGYDSDDWYHLNFGWGGLYNGYYPLYSGVSFKADIKFSSYPTPVFVSREKFEVNQADSLILVKIHNAFNGTTGWDLNTSVYNWKNIDIVDGRVVSLQYFNDYYSELFNIPDEIAGLTELTELRLYGNFKGELTSDIFKLTKLKWLSIVDNSYKNEFKITITQDIGNLTELESLTLNQLQGSIPSSIGNLKKLKYLTIWSGNLSGSIPPEIGNLENLSSLQIEDNQLTGSIPATIGDLGNLTTLDLRANQFTAIEDGEWKNTKLKSLSLNDNQIEGKIPVSFKNFTELDWLELQNNKITALPDELSALVNLEYINIDDNKLTQIPDNWSSLTKLNYFSANNNEISKFTSEFRNWGKLETFSLSNNKLTEFPNSLSLLSVKKIDVSRNKIQKLPANIELMLGNVSELYLQDNEISESLPLSLMIDSVIHIRLDSNLFVFNHIPHSDDYLRVSLGTQKEIKLSKNTIKVAMGDTVLLDANQLYPYLQTDDETFWLLYSEYKDEEYQSRLEEQYGEKKGQTLKVVIDKNTINNKYYCKIFNKNSPERFYRIYYQGDWHTGTVPVLSYLNTEPIQFELANDIEKYADKYDVKVVSSSSEIPDGTVEDKIVTLVPPMRMRGTLIWQASADGKTWYDLSETMQQNDLKSNLVSVKSSELVLSPKTPAYYRCNVQDINCEPLYSDTLKVNPFGKVLYDETINAATAIQTIKTDSIEVTLPQGIHDKDFRLTISKSDNAPAVADTLQGESVYDVTVSFGEVFDRPILIKMNTIDKSKFDSKEIHSYKAAYFDEVNKKWVIYDNSYVSLQDTALYFETNHLTKVRVIKDQDDYDRLWEKYNVRVYYRDVDEGHINLYKNSTQSWDTQGAPIMVQDVAYYMAQILIKFTKLGFNVPQVFTVYIDNIEDDGVVGLLGMKNGYMTINRAIEEGPEKLRSLLAHEYMHYTQSDYVTPQPGNIFWMEANGHLSDRLVWDESVISISESENYLLSGSKSENSIFNFLANSWDYWDKGFTTQNFFGNVHYCYLAGTFLHYMRSYSQAEKKLDPVALLKETKELSTGISWLQYLSNYIAFSMNSTIGDEYENFVKYIFEGSNSKFNVLKKDDPYGYIIENSSSKYEFATSIFYRFDKKDKIEDIVKEDEISLTLPYLSSKILMLNNFSNDVPVVVNYKPHHTWDRDNKVYYGYYDFKSKKMQYVDITDSLSYSIIIEPTTDVTRKEFSNISFLMFINKQDPTISKASDFEASFKLTAIPVMNIQDIALANVSDKNIHTYSNGNKRSFVLSGRMNFSYLSDHTDLNYKELSYSTSRAILNDSCYQVTVNYSYHFDQETVINAPSGLNVYDIEQIIVYNFKASSLDIQQKTKQSIYIKDWMELPSKKINTGRMTGTMEEYQHVTFLNLVNPTTVSVQAIGDAIQYTYPSTGETKAFVKINAHTVKRSDYNTDGTVASVESSHYVSSDYSEEGITSDLFIHYK